MAKARQVNTRTHVLSGAILAGLAQAATVYIFAALFRLRVTGVSEFLGGIFTNDTAAALRNGRIILAVVALLWGACYQGIRSRLPRQQYVRGITFGLLVWTGSTGLLLPLLTIIQTRGPAPGFFALGFGGLSAALVSLSAHLVYGVILSLYIEADAEQPVVPEPGPA